MFVVYSVYDRVSGLYGLLNQAPNVDSAKRNIKLSFNRDPMLLASMGDYDFVLLGTFDDKRGNLIFSDDPVVVPVSDIINSVDGVTEGAVKNG